MLLQQELNTYLNFIYTRYDYELLLLAILIHKY